MNARIVLVVVLMSGCEFEGPRPAPDGGVPRAPNAQVTVSGLVHDVEYFVASFLSCASPDECPPPLLGAVPPMLGGVVPNASVTVHAQSGVALGTAAEPTNLGGRFLVAFTPNDDAPVTLRTTVDTTLPPPEGEPFPRQWHPDMNFVPTYGFVPTATLTPVHVSASQHCLSRRAVVFGLEGVLAAVAKRRGVRASDLLDPGQFGGVLVWWNLAPDEVFVWSPAMATRPTFSVGEAMPVTWAPPGALGAAQVPYGFAVADANEPETWVGLAVVVLPKTTNAYTEVEVRTVDAVNDPEVGRPWQYEPMVVRVAPGLVSYGESTPVGGGTLFGGPAPDELCTAP